MQFRLILANALIFPAYAGVNPCPRQGRKQDLDLPRVCGGEPAEHLPERGELVSSPRMRG